MGVATAVRVGRKTFLAAGLAVLATVSVAQTVPDQEVPATGLDLPANLQIFGKADPNIRKATAIVNETVITGTDVDQRLAMTLALNDLKVTEEDKARLRVTILRQLIDETLQIQEAKSNKIEVTRDDIDQSFNRVARNLGRTPEQMRAWLRQVGSSERSFKRQVEGELSWNRLLRRRVSVEVSDAEVNAILARLRADKGTEEYHIYEIYLNATPERSDEVYAAEQQVIEQLKKGTPFEAIARSISEATTRSTGGDLGWLRTSSLPESLSKAVQSMSPGQVAGPIAVPGGFSVIYLADKRTILGTDPRDAKLSLKQMTITFPAGTTQAQATARASEFATATRAMQGCGDAARVAGTLNATVVDNDTLRIRNLPAALAEMIANLQVGQATPPFGTVEDGVRVLVLCGRDDPQTAAEPTPDQISETIVQNRTSVRAQRLLRDLRRDALVEYR